METERCIRNVLNVLKVIKNRIIQPGLVYYNINYLQYKFFHGNVPNYEDLIKIITKFKECKH